MTRTKRKYNNPRTKIFKVLTRLDCYTIYEPDYHSYVESMKNRVLCMGHCKRCKDRKKDQQERTLKIKNFHVLKNEDYDPDDILDSEMPVMPIIRNYPSNAIFYFPIC